MTQARRILVIEDNETNLELMVYLLRSFNHVVLTAGDGVQGLEIARREIPDLIICDVHLPEVDGFEVVRQLKASAKLRKIPLVAVTAMAMVGDREKVINAGFDYYVSKPIIPEDFIKDMDLFLTKTKKIKEGISNGHNPHS